LALWTGQLPMEHFLAGVFDPNIGTLLRTFAK
jgi:hypothetical protein